MPYPKNNQLVLQLNEYEREPYFLQFFQSNTTVCLITCFQVSNKQAGWNKRVWLAEFFVHYMKKDFYYNKKCEGKNSKINKQPLLDRYVRVHFL